MKKAERRKRMAELLERFPLLVQETEDYVHLYPQARKLTSCIERLYIEIIGAIEEMIQWYLERPLSKHDLLRLFISTYPNRTKFQIRHGQRFLWREVN